MTSWWHDERLDAAVQAVRDSDARSVVDLGCGDGDLIVRLLGEHAVTRILGVDICQEALARLRRRLQEQDGGGTGEEGPARVRLVCASMIDADPAMQGFDCAVLLETIEHLDPGDLSRLERALFRRMTPRTAVITTPNAEFNGLLGVPPHRFRHPGHRFEWPRAKFRHWAHGVAARNGYAVRCTDIAGSHPDLGGASQMAVFTRPAGHAGQAPRNV